MSSNSPLSPSRSVESGLDKTPMRRGGNTKNDDWVFATPEKPIGSSKNLNANRKVMGSIERGLDKVNYYQLYNFTYTISQKLNKYSLFF
jgi:hypothetical protein